MRYTSVPCQQVGSPFLPLVVESNFLQKSQLCAFASTLVSKVIHQRLLSPKKGLSFRKALGKLGVIPTSGDAIFHTCVETNFFPKAKKPQVYHKAINPDMQSHTRLLWCGFGGSAAIADYIISSVPHTVFFRMNTPARTNARGIAQNDAQMDHRPDALLFAPRIQHRMVSAVLRLTQGDSCHL